VAAPVLPPPSRLRMHVFLAFGAAVWGSAAIVATNVPGLKELPVWLVASVGVAAILFPCLAISLGLRAPLGFVAGPSGFLLWGVAWLLGRPPLEGLLLLAGGPALFVVWELLVAPALRRSEARRALALVDAAAAPPELVAFLGHAADGVRARAALRMGTFRAANVAELLRTALRAAETRTRAAARTALLHQARTPDGFDLARDAFREQIRERDVVLAAEAAHALAGLDALGDLVASLAPGEERAPVRLAYARGLLAATAASDGTGSRASLAATLLASVLGDPKVDVSAREAALDAFDDVPPRETRAVALPLLVRGDATPELLWLLVEHGAPEDAPRVARWAAREPYARASAAVAALEAIVDRAGSTGLGLHARATREGTVQARDALRAAHPPKDNALADELVERLEGVIAELPVVAPAATSSAIARPPAPPVVSAPEPLSAVAPVFPAGPSPAEPGPSAPAPAAAEPAPAAPAAAEPALSAPAPAAAEPAPTAPAPAPVVVEAPASEPTPTEPGTPPVGGGSGSA
jgi:hypothetical protein